MRTPRGFVVESVGRRTLVCRPGCLDEVRRMGLDDPNRWEELVAGAPEGPGRGRAVRLEVSRRPRWVLKQMKRGGFAGPLWRDRFPGTGRLVENLTLPLELLRRGIPTAAPVILLVVEGPKGFNRAFLAIEEIEGAVDLRTRLSVVPPPSRAEMAAVLSLVRRTHDAGLEHRDLNLGNLLVRARDSGEPDVFVADLDRAVLREEPLGFAARQAALRRLERSYAKSFGESGPLGACGSSLWYGLYAGTDRELARRLKRGRAMGRAWLALHRLGWRSSSLPSDVDRRSARGK